MGVKRTVIYEDHLIKLYKMDYQDPTLEPDFEIQMKSLHSRLEIKSNDGMDDICSIEGTDTNQAEIILHRADLVKQTIENAANIGKPRCKWTTFDFERSDGMTTRIIQHPRNSYRY